MLSNWVNEAETKADNATDNRACRVVSLGLPTC